MLRDGADPHAQPAPTPAQRASAIDGEVSRLVLRAARPWSRDSHELYPNGARARAVELLRLGQQLSLQPRFTGEGQALMDVWVTHVMPHVVRRGGIAEESAEREAAKRAAGFGVWARRGESCAII